MFRQLQFVSQVVSLPLCACVWGACRVTVAIALCVCVSLAFLCVTWEFPLLLFDLATSVHITYTQRIIPQKGHWFFWFAFSSVRHSPLFVYYFDCFSLFSSFYFFVFHFFLVWGHGYAAVCDFLCPAQKEKYLLAIYVYSSVFISFFFLFVFGTFGHSFFILVARCSVHHHIHTLTHSLTLIHWLTHTHTLTRVRNILLKYKLLTISFALDSCCCCCAAASHCLLSHWIFSENSTTTRFDVWPRSEPNFPQPWWKMRMWRWWKVCEEKSPSGGSRFSSHRTCAFPACRWHTFPRQPSPMKWIFRPLPGPPLHPPLWAHKLHYLHGTSV